MTSVITVGYVWQILGRAGDFLLPIPPKREQPQKDSCWRGLKPIQNRKILFRNNFHPMSFERASRGDQYLIFVCALESCFIQTNLLVFQLSALVGLSSKMIELRLTMSWMVFFLRNNVKVYKGFFAYFVAPPWPGIFLQMWSVFFSVHFDG